MTRLLDRTPFFLPVQEEKFHGFKLGDVMAEYKKLAASFGADRDEEKEKGGQILRKDERPKRLGKVWWALFGNMLITGIGSCIHSKHGVGVARHSSCHGYCN